MRPTELLMQVAERLGELRTRVVFVGGATSELLITDPATPPVSATKDIDVIISVPNGLSINLISAPCFLATKLDAFHDRGGGDYQG